MGDFDEQNSSETITQDLLQGEGEQVLRYTPCINTKNITTAQIEALVEETGSYAIFIEEGLNKDHIPILSNADLVIAKTYQRRAFRGLENIVIIDANSFKKQKRNSDYKDESFFTDIHTSYSENIGVIGFGDYTITGDDFTESGGPAYVVTIHLSYTKPEEFDDMYVRHFKSFDNASPTQPGEKFGNALSKLINFADENNEVLYSTLGLQGYYALNQAGHFPGLGQVKKLSMQHHIETLCRFLGDKNE